LASNKVKIREATVHIPINKQECVSFKQSCIIAKKIIAITIQIQLFSKKMPIPIKIKIGKLKFQITNQQITIQTKFTGLKIEDIPKKNMQQCAAKFAAPDFPI
jgi:hypothetical protein